MAHKYLILDESKVPQSEPIEGTVPNSAGGYSFEVDMWKRLERFLVLGSEGGSYYASERQLTTENTKNLEACLRADGFRFLNTVVDISSKGRAPKNDPALFALAVAFAHGDAKTRADAALALRRVARIGTHLFHFVDYVDSMRGWGRGLRSAVSDWYRGMEPERLAYQLMKYQSRDGWSHRDVLRKAHPKTKQGDHNTLFRWAVGKEANLKGFAMLEAFEELKKLPVPPDATRADKNKVIALIVGNKLPRECVPTEWLNDVDIWEALLLDMPMTAMIRNLGKMTSIGLIAPLSSAGLTVSNHLRDAARVRRSMIHPLNLLVALKTYESGHGVKGSLTWTPVKNVLGGIEDAYYTSFGNVPKTGKSHYLALDVSGSMGFDRIAGMPITPRDAAAALAMVAARTEDNYYIAGFQRTLIEIPITDKTSLVDVMKITSNLPFSGTDCAQPMLDAISKKMNVDIFHVYTDSETWAGKIHPSQALKQYRQKFGIPAKLAVIGMVANNFTIADPNDSGMLDVVGFDTATPAILADFATDGKVSVNLNEGE